MIKARTNIKPSNIIFYQAEKRDYHKNNNLNQLLFIYAYNLIFIG